VKESVTTHASELLHRAITLITLVVILAATFVFAFEIVFVLFLGIVFSVFLTKLSTWLTSKLSLGYRGSLALVVSTILLLGIGLTFFFFAQVNQQLEKASGLLEKGTVELRKRVDRNPMLASAVANIPLLSAATEKQEDESKQEPSASKNGNANKDDKQNEVASKDDKQKKSASKDDKKESESSEKSGSELDSASKPVSGIAGKIGQLFKSTFGWVVNSVLIFFVGLFFAISPNSYRDGLVRLVPPSRRERITEVLNSSADTLWRWLIGRFGSMLATGGGAFVLLLALQVPMAATLGILTGLLTFVPNIGAAVALLLAVVFALPQGTGTVAAVVGGYMVVQLVESYIVTPLIEQKAVSIPPALVIAFQAIMSVLFGFVGAVVASPALAVGKKVVEMLYIDD
jgi:predicted PurR-regulated permease PerM